MAKGDISKGGRPEDFLIEVESPSDIDNLVVGDAIILTGAYEVARSLEVGRPIFGQIANINPGTGAVDVRYAGLCTFAYDGEIAPFIDGLKGVELSSEPGGEGRVTKPNTSPGYGVVVSVDEDAKTVDVIL